MNAPLLKQHLIDPEICIRCNTCEETCPVDAVTHDDNNYVVDASQVQFLHGLHLALPDRLDRQLAHGGGAYSAWKSSFAGWNCRRRKRWPAPPGRRAIERE
jgi:ferredoxin